MCQDTPVGRLPLTITESLILMVLAYLDPGSGSMLIQAVLAGMLTLPFFLRSQIGQLVRRIRRPEAQENVSTDDSQ